jgi:hypothetical protein
MATCGPIRSHSTDTSEAPWNGSRNQTRLGDADQKTLRRACAWSDCDGDPSNKSSYKFIHHEVSKEAGVGAANVRACTNGIAVLNGARGGAAIPPGDRKGVYNHLARHVRDAGKEPAELKP